VEEGDGEVVKLSFQQLGARGLKTQNLLSILMIVLGTALLIYFSRNGVLREMARSPDLFVVIAIVVVVNSFLFLSLRQPARVFINQHRKLILKIGIAMLLFFFLSPFVLLCILISLNITVNLPDHYLDAILWTDFGLAFIGMMVAMIPAHVKFFEYLRSTRKQ
jgi:hypothetical protein